MIDLLPFGSISVIILIRTDTTLDLSQKAEKVCKATASKIFKTLNLRKDVLLNGWSIKAYDVHSPERRRNRSSSIVLAHTKASELKTYVKKSPCKKSRLP